MLFSSFLYSATLLAFPICVFSQNMYFTCNYLLLFPIYLLLSTIVYLSSRPLILMIIFVLNILTSLIYFAI